MAVVPHIRNIACGSGAAAAGRAALPAEGPGFSRPRTVRGGPTRACNPPPRRPAHPPAIRLAGAFRRSELLALTVADLAMVPEGMRITVRRSKTDQTGAGQMVAIPHGARIRPIRTWLDAAGITEGPLFRPVLHGGRVPPATMSDDAAVWAIKRRAKAAGLDPSMFAGHSLRSGFMTSASQTGATLPKMMEVSRHRSVDSAMSYIRDRDAFRYPAGSGFL